jgi:hypothetical protein
LQTEKLASIQAIKEIEEEKRLQEEAAAQLLNIRSGRFVNEKDFSDDEKGSAAEQYKQFMSQYISYRYEPCHEEFEDARYFTEHWENYIF